MKIREEATLSLTPAADYTAKEGYLVTVAAGVATVSSSATTKAVGVITEPNLTAAGYASEKVTVHMLGGQCGTLHMRAGGTIAQGAFVQQSTDGTVVTDAGSGARVLVGIAMESAVSGDLFEVAPLAPLTLS